MRRCAQASCRKSHFWVSERRQIYLNIPFWGLPLRFLPDLPVVNICVSLASRQAICFAKPADSIASPELSLLYEISVHSSHLSTQGVTRSHPIKVRRVAQLDRLRLRKLRVVR